MIRGSKRLFLVMAASVIGMTACGDDDGTSPPQTGSIVVETITTGSALDDSYGISIDDSPAGTIGANASRCKTILDPIIEGSRTSAPAQTANTKTNAKQTHLLAMTCLLTSMSLGLSACPCHPKSTRCPSHLPAQPLPPYHPEPAMRHPASPCHPELVSGFKHLAHRTDAPTLV